LCFLPVFIKEAFEIKNHFQVFSNMSSSIKKNPVLDFLSLFDSYLIKGVNLDLLTHIEFFFVVYFKYKLVFDISIIVHNNITH
jgi:hypothetical protein